MGRRGASFGLVALLCLGPMMGAPPSMENAAASVVEEAATARIDPATSRIADFGADLHVELALSRAVPWRVFTLEAPRRLVIDFAEVDFTGAGLSPITASDAIEGLSMGTVAPGWSRLAISLAAPMNVETAGMSSGEAVLKIQLAPSTEREFAAAAGAPESDIFVPATGEAPKPDLGDLRVMLDPGGAAPESPLVDDLRAELETNGIEVALDGASGEADVMLSLHSDTLTTDAPRPAGNPHAEALAAHLVSALAADAESPQTRPRIRANFSASDGAEIPSVLLQIGAPAPMADPAWRRRAVTAIRTGLEDWATGQSDLSRARPY